MTTTPPNEPLDESTLKAEDLDSGDAGPPVVRLRPPRPKTAAQPTPWSPHPPIDEEPTTDAS